MNQYEYRNKKKLSSMIAEKILRRLASCVWSEAHDAQARLVFTQTSRAYAPCTSIRTLEVDPRRIPSELVGNQNHNGIEIVIGSCENKKLTP